jgi:hypothetical protein
MLRSTPCVGSRDLTQYLAIGIIVGAAVPIACH